MISVEKKVHEYTQYSTITIAKLSPVDAILEVLCDKTQEGEGNIPLSLYQLERIRHCCYVNSEGNKIFLILESSNPALIRSIKIETSEINRAEIIGEICDEAGEVTTFVISSKEFYDMISKFMLATFKNIVG